MFSVCNRDVFWQGTCDDGCYNLADKLGWKVSFFDVNRMKLEKMEWSCVKKDDGEWVKKCMDFMVEGVRPRVRHRP